MRQRAGLFLMLIGLVLAGLATLLVMNIARQASEAGRGTVKQVAVVAALRDIPDQTLIPADALVMRPFPADFVPAGAITSPAQVVGQVANGFIAKDQVLVVGQISAVRRSPNLSDRIPAGKVVVWLPMPELISAAGVLRPGDHIDILLTMPLIPSASSNGTSQSGGPGSSPPTLSASSSGAGNNGVIGTQTTLQNVEVYGIGAEELSRAALVNNTNATAQAPPGTDPAQPAQGAGPRPVPASRAVGFLVDHQDAVIAKFIKDSGGMIDFVVRSTDEQQIVRTDAMTMDAIAERFRFRMPQPIRP